ncbi:hypothetical protein [Calothrix sp. CCY 0018]
MSVSICDEPHALGESDVINGNALSQNYIKKVNSPWKVFFYDEND